jgi:hypothetical protein
MLNGFDMALPQLLVTVTVICSLVVGLIEILLFEPLLP